MFSVWAPALVALLAVLGSADDWRGVEFRAAQFDQTLQLAHDKWLDPPQPGSVAERQGFQRAAELALWSLEPTVELVPDAYLAYLAGAAKDPWQPTRKPDRLTCQGKTIAGLSLVAAEISARDKQALQQAWEQWYGQGNPWGRTELGCALSWIEMTLPPSDERRERINLAWVNAASGYLKAHDHNSDVVAQRFWERVSQSEQVAESADPGLTPGPCPPAQPGWCVADVRKDSAAWKQDLRVGDRLEQLGDLQVAGRSRQELDKALIGAQGSIVQVTLIGVRDGKPRTCKLARNQAVTPDVEAALLPGGLIHVALRDFVPGTADRFAREIAAALRPKKSKKPITLQAILLDLRGNPGGLLNESVRIADQLLGQGLVVSTRWKGRLDDKRSVTQPSDLPAKMVVLVDRRCGSACEILAGALQDRGRGVVLGTRTYGKASIQEVKQPNLLAGYYLKLTVGHYLSPKGRNFDGTGLQPDVALPTEPTTVFAAAAAGLDPVRRCVEENGQAVRAAVSDRAPRRRVDPWLLMAADWLSCVPEAPRP